ncbi:MAG: SPFH domain-containing protein [Saprospiraceae bacterium]
MKKKQFLFILVTALFTICFTACSTKNEIIKELRDHVHANNFPGVRLGDGVPLALNISVRWKIQSPTSFYSQFSSPDSFNLVVLQARTSELVKNISNSFESVDSVFSTHRFQYISAIKDGLLKELGEEGIQIKEVMVADIQFPKRFTDAMENVSLQEQELARIRNQNKVELEKAEANRKKAEADGMIAIAQAEAQGKLQKIQAQTEKSNRQSELAKAETQAQVDKMRAQTEAKRKRLLAQADLESKRELKDLEMQKKREIEQIQVEKQRSLDQVDFEKQMALAKLCLDNPTYASFLVNKELASHVQIAVLPSGTDANVFGNLLNQKIPATQTSN